MVVEKSAAATEAAVNIQAEAMLWFLKPTGNNRVGKMIDTVEVPTRRRLRCECQASQAPEDALTKALFRIQRKEAFHPHPDRCAACVQALLNEHEPVLT